MAAEDAFWIYIACLVVAQAVAVFYILTERHDKGGK